MDTLNLDLLVRSGDCPVETDESGKTDEGTRRYVEGLVICAAGVVSDWSESALATERESITAEFRRHGHTAQQQMAAQACARRIVEGVCPLYQLSAAGDGITTKK